MAEIEPLRALHYHLATVGSLADVVAPPYDVIDSDQREALLARSPFNVVAVDLPKADAPSGAPGAGVTNTGAVAALPAAALPADALPADALPADGPPTGGPPTGGPPTGGDRDRDPYATAGELFESWQLQGAIVRDPEPAIWAHTQDYTGPDGVRQTRRGFFCRVHIEEYGPGGVRPHERTHPGPREDRLRLTRATRANMSPIFSLYSDPERAAWGALEPATRREAPWGEATDSEGTTHRIWRVTDAQAIAAVRRATQGRELLIADGHHRYETARAYAQELGGEGEHRYVLMCLVALEDPGLTVFPTHRLVGGLDAERRERLERALEESFESAEVELDQLAPPAGEGPLTLGYIDSATGRPKRLTLKDQAIADAALREHAAPYRRLDTGVLEALLLKGALGLGDDDISHLHDFGYARDARQAVELVQTGAYDAAFLMRPTPVAQVSEVAQAGENMPPKSTFFYPKLLTGLLFNPLS